MLLAFRTRLSAAQAGTSTCKQTDSTTALVLNSLPDSSTTMQCHSRLLGRLAAQQMQVTSSKSKQAHGVASLSRQDVTSAMASRSLALLSYGATDIRVFLLM